MLKITPHHQGTKIGKKGYKSSGKNHSLNKICIFVRIKTKIMIDKTRIKLLENIKIR